MLKQHRLRFRSQCDFLAWVVQQFGRVRDIKNTAAFNTTAASLEFIQPCFHATKFHRFVFRTNYRLTCSSLMIPKMFIAMCLSIICAKSYNFEYRSPPPDTQPAHKQACSAFPTIWPTHVTTENNLCYWWNWGSTLMGRVPNFFLVWHCWYNRVMTVQQPQKLLYGGQCSKNDKYFDNGGLPPKKRTYTLGVV